MFYMLLYSCRFGEIENFLNYTIVSPIYILPSFLCLHNHLFYTFLSMQSVLSSEEDRESLESVEGLLKKHENFEKSLAAQEEKFKVIKLIVTIELSLSSLQAIDDAATGMIANSHYASPDIDHHRQTV